MQPHEGPGRDRAAEERYRQRVITKWLLVIIAALIASIALVLFGRGLP